MKITRLRAILITVIIGFLVTTFCVAFWTYRQTLELAEYGSLMRLRGIANAVGQQIKGEKHAALFQKYLQKDGILHADDDSLYLEIHHILKSNYAANMLASPLYTIHFDSLEKRFCFGVTSSEMPYFRHPYNSPPAELTEKRAEGANIPMYSDEFGTWLSAFAPIKNSRGEVVALIQADEHFDGFLEKIKSQVIQNILIVLSIFSVLLLVLLWILQPIIAREQAAKTALENANQKITELDQFRREMMANVSHDLRTPMASILGYAETLLQKDRQINEPDRVRYLQIVAAESRRMNSMISELFDLSKLENGQIQLEKEPVNVCELAQDNLFKYREIAKNRNIELFTEFDPNTPLVEADTRWLDRVIQNLLDNAFKYAGDNGFIKITIFTKAENLHFKVCNSGRTLENDQLAHVFDRYFRSTNRNKDSTGLGLAIVKKTIELHGGRVWAELSEGITTFRFELPQK